MAKAALNFVIFVAVMSVLFLPTQDPVLLWAALLGAVAYRIYLSRRR